MKTLITALSLVWCGSASFAGEAVRGISWAELAKEGKLQGGEVIPANDKMPSAHLKVENPDATPKSISILTIENPGVTKLRYALRGKVRYEGVEGQGCLEMWNFLSNGGKYFSRTIGGGGPMKALQGSSGWREFVLPFFMDQEGLSPNKLVVKVVLPGRGTVYLGPLQLMQYDKNEDPLAVAGQWWGPRGAGLLGAILGTALGCLGAAVGVLTSKGMARSLVLGTLKLTAVVGIVFLLAGIAATIAKQPYHVFHPLLLVGLLGTVIPLGVLKTCRKRFEEMELRKMAAMDAS